MGGMELMFFLNEALCPAVITVPVGYEDPNGITFHTEEVELKCRDYYGHMFPHVSTIEDIGVDYYWE